MSSVRTVKIMLYGNAVVVVCATLYFLLIPGVLVLHRISDSALREGRIPGEAWRLHKYLTPRFAEYAEARIASGAAANVNYRDVAATEWPLFGAVFYLWATENLQRAWEKGGCRCGTAPAVYARKTIEACGKLLADPVQHSWVRRHWGDKYMHTSDVFFRSLLIAGLASYDKLLATGEYLPLLKDQCDTLAAELDASPHGVLEDYPGECYPIDVFAAMAWIRKADEVTGLDHSAFVKREMRAFRPPYLDKRGLIPWMADPVTGKATRPNSRGIINSHVLTFAPDVCPDDAKEWYRRYEKYFWQKTWYGEGWREFYRDDPDADLLFDVDAGPIIGGFGPAANAFGFAAAERNGRLDQAYLLAVQIIAASWPLPDGTLLGPRLLSDSRNAPYLGETGLLWQLSTTPPSGAEIVKPAEFHWPGSIYLAILFYFGIPLLVAVSGLFNIARFAKLEKAGKVPEYRGLDTQFRAWCLFLGIGIVIMASGLIWGGAVVLACVLLPKFEVRAVNP